MAIGLVRKIRARKGCASGVHVKFHKPASKWTVEKAIIEARYRSDSKASQVKLNLSYAARHRWTGWMPWAGTFTETRNLGLLEWHLERKRKNDRSKISKKNTKRTRATATNKRGGKGNSSLKQRTKKVVGKSKRSDKRAKTRTI